MLEPYKQITGAIKISISHTTETGAMLRVDIVNDENKTIEFVSTYLEVNKPILLTGIDTKFNLFINKPKILTIRHE